MLGALGKTVDASSAGLAPLRQLATTAVMRLLKLEQLLFETLDTLNEHGIDVMLLKGAGLAYSVYPSFADRPMGDLDVLVGSEAAHEVWSLLQERGWTWPKERVGAGRYTAHQHLPPLVKLPERFRLEIHTDLLPGGHPFRFNTATVWAGARRVARDGRQFVVSDPVHQLWHTCLHFTWQHEMLWGAWRALRDNAAIVAGSFDWPAFVEMARETRAATVCYWALRLSRRLAAAAVPDHVLAALHPGRSEFVLEKLERHYVSNLVPSEGGCPSVWLTRRLWEAGIRPRWSGHRQARPWEVGDRWEAGDGGMTTRKSGPLSFQQRVQGVGRWWRYFNHIRRFALPQ